MARQADTSDLDPGIRDAVLLLQKAGFKTFTSCEGGRGHSFRHETIGLELDGDYRSFQKRLVKFLRSQGMQCFQVNLVASQSRNNAKSLGSSSFSFTGCFAVRSRPIFARAV